MYSLRAAGVPARAPAAGKIIRRRHTLRDTRTLHEEYDEVLVLTTTPTITLAAACKKIGISRSAFGDRRYITELHKTDETLYSTAVEAAATDKLSVQAFNDVCKNHLQGSPAKHIYSEMKREGKLLA